MYKTHILESITYPASGSMARALMPATKLAKEGTNYQLLKKDTDNQFFFKKKITFYCQLK